MATKWITDRLPKFEDTNDRDEVLVTTADNTVRVASFSGSTFDIKGSGWCESTTVKAWAKMPEPYMEDKVMTKLTNKMLKYLLSAYDNADPITRLIWRLRVRLMTDEKIMQTYYMLTDKH